MISSVQADDLGEYNKDNTKHHNNRSKKAFFNILFVKDKIAKEHAENNTHAFDCDNIRNKTERDCLHLKKRRCCAQKSDQKKGKKVPEGG